MPVALNSVAGREAHFVLRLRMAAFPAAATDEALQYFLSWVAEAIDADNVIWIGGVRVLEGEEGKADPFLGWRLRARVALRPDPENYRRQLASYYNGEHYGKLTPTYYERSHEAKKEDHIGMDSRATMAGTGRFRAYRMRDAPFDFEAFKRTPHYRLYYEDSGIIDRILVGFPVVDGRESFLMVDRFQIEGAPRRRPFSLAETTFVGDAFRGLPEFHRRLFLGNGLLVDDKPLSPTERKILQGLLTGMSEKEIADSTGQKVATLHKYVTGLYARFRVKSRPALMALWLEGA